VSESTPLIQAEPARSVQDWVSVPIDVPIDVPTDTQHPAAGPALAGSARGFRRPVSPNEWLYLGGMRVAPPFAVQVMVEGRGRIDRGELAHAVGVASAASPGARLVRRGRTWVDSGRTPPVHEVEAAALDPRAPAGAALLRPLDADAGPTCEVVLVDGESSTLVFRAFHGVMDGRGALAWITDVFRALRGEVPVGAASAATDYGLAAELGNVGRRPRLALAWRPPLDDSGASTAPGEFFFRRRGIDGNHPGLVAKIAAALAGGAGHERSRFMVPVDLRRHDPGLASTGNLSLPIFLDARPGEAWQDLHERLLRAMAERREVTGGALERAAALMPLGALGTTLAATSAFAGWRRRYLCSAIVSHVGRLDLGEFCAEGFEATAVCPLPAHAPFAPVSCAVVETEGRTDITLSCQDGPAMADRAEALLDRISDALAPAGTRDWAGNDTAAPVRPETVLELFRAQVDRTPDAVALTGPEGEVSYAELDRRSDVVAHALRTRGVGRGDIVGLIVDRTVTGLAGLWGILKSGAAWLPLEPKNPDSRLSFMLEDTGAPLCLAQRRYRDRIAAVAGCDVVVLDDLPVAGAPRAPVAAAGPEDLVWVIYTSGSTGRPKGVQVEHRNLAGFLAWARREFCVVEAPRFVLLTSLAFDMSCEIVFPPLVAGGSVVLVPGELNHVNLRTALEGSGADVLIVTPAHLDLIGRLDLAPTGFSLLVVGGELVTGAVAARAQQQFGPGCRILNHYGPTETTIATFLYPFDAHRDAAAPGLPIGRPLDNTQVFLLDDHRRHVARGEVGEICLAGAQLARGYLGRPELDRERFVHLADGTRVYRTGDLGRLLPTDVVEFVGRSDDQIKIRGQRLEPGEVAAVLAGHPGVAGAVVVGRPHGGDQALCAYLVADRELAVPELRAYLADRLPPYMVPAAFVQVDEIPCNVNGKVDVGALPDPFGGQDSPSGPAAGPAETGGAADPGRRDPVEAAVARIWAEILYTDADRIGPDADFHRLGGDSVLLLAMLASVVKTVVGPEREDAFMADLRELIHEPSLDRVCAAVRRATA
jgi:amino acid adenylation domain-containing protein